MARPPLSRDRSAWPWAVLGGALGLLIAFACFAPARWLASGLAGATGGHLQLLNPRGTIWQGSANVVLSGGPGGTTAISLPGLLRWQLWPRWNGAGAALELPCCAPEPLRFQARLGSGLQLDWQDGRSHWPANLLTGLGAPWNTLKPEGTLELATRGFSMVFQNQQMRFGGQAVMEATDISSSLSTLRPMGSYRFTLDGGTPSTVLLTTRDGSLQLSGSGRWENGRLRFNGEASAAPGREDALGNLLNIIGRRDGARTLINLG